jgi:hypothetical protein
MSNRPIQARAVGVGVGTAAVTAFVLAAVAGGPAPPGSSLVAVLFCGAIGGMAAAWVAPERRWRVALPLAAIVGIIACVIVGIGLARGGSTGVGGYAVLAWLVGVILACALIASCGARAPWARWAAGAGALVVALGVAGALRTAGGYVLAMVEREGIPALNDALGKQILAKAGVAWDQPDWDRTAPIGVTAGGLNPSAQGGSRLDGLQVSFKLDIRLPEALEMEPAAMGNADPVYTVAWARAPGQRARGTLRQLLVQIGIKPELTERLNGFSGTIHGIHFDVGGVPGSPGGPSGGARVEHITVAGSGTYTEAG